MSNLRAYLLCRFADRSSVYSSWIDDAGLPTTVVDEFLPDWQVPDDAGILVTHMHYRWEELTALRRVLQRGDMPILILSDGILEYRNTWEHPNLVDGSMFQPLFGHKLACIGRGQARVIESWGNAGKCEVVGLPRLDGIRRAALPPVKTTGPFRILIATAKTPAFDDQQREAVRQSLVAVQQWIANNREIQGRKIVATWRLSDQLDSELGVSDGIALRDRPPIGDVIEDVDAVITTPSTLYLESILRHRPTALLDFHHSPQYVTAAWTISSASRLNPVIRELADPPVHKMMFQEFVLHDQLACQSPAKPRMVDLIRRMVEAGITARTQRRPIELPGRILTDPEHGLTRVPEQFDPATLYAHNACFQDRESDQLQVELAAAVQRLKQLPFEIADKNQRIGYLMRTLDRLRKLIQELRSKIKSLAL